MVLTPLLLNEVGGSPVDTYACCCRTNSRAFGRRLLACPRLLWPVFLAKKIQSVLRSTLVMVVMLRVVVDVLQHVDLHNAVIELGSK